MSGYEEQLHARAEMLEETSDLADEVAGIHAGAGSAGIDPQAVISLADAIRELDPAGSVPAYSAGSRHDRQAGGGYGSDAEFLEAIADADEQIIIRRADAQRLREEISAARDAVMDDLDAATRDLEKARLALAAAYALPVNDPCRGCHGIKQAAIASAQAAVDQAEAAITDARRKTGILGDAAEILDALHARLTHAIEALRRVPHDLGEVYELIYEFLRGGGKLPRYGRWIGGDPART